MKQLVVRFLLSALSALLYLSLISPMPASTTEIVNVNGPNGGKVSGDKECFLATGLGEDVTCNDTGSFGKVNLDFDEEVEAFFTNKNGNTISVGDQDTGFKAGDWGAWYCKDGQCIQMEYTFRCCDVWWGWDCEILAWGPVPAARPGS